MRARAIALVAALFLLVGCATYPVNPCLTTWDPTHKAGYRFRGLADDGGRADHTFVVLALSGGGTRAAALAYGVMQELSTAKLKGRGETLLDEVDVISAVSGGSFAAGYYGAFGKKAFLADFPKEVLYRPIERDLILQILAPWNWPRLLSWWYGRSDLADRYYDREIFAGKRFGDLPRVRPLIQINATDIERGARFSFVQDDFDRLCSDLSGVHISRAVTASSAFPVAFTPLTLKNRPSTVCGYERPGWVDSALKDLETNASRYDRARDWISYEDPNRPFVHLSDGGLADNIGLRGPMNALLNPAADIDLVRRINEGHVDRVVFVVVDARPEAASGRDESAHPPWIGAVLEAAATNPMENYSTDTIELARKFASEWKSGYQDLHHIVEGCGDLAQRLCGGPPGSSCRSARRKKCLESMGLDAAGKDLGPHPAFYLIHVRFEAEKNVAERKALEAIGTRLQLSHEDVDRVIAAGHRLLRRSTNYRCLMQAIGETNLPPPADAACPE